MTAPVRIVEYDPAWPRRFAEERAVLAEAFAGTRATIEHIGSTAVPGLGAKPVIDILAGVANLAAAESRIAALEAAGYEYVREYDAVLPERRYFRKPRSGRRAFHLHCVVEGGDLWVRHLAFRDHLRAHPAAAAAYLALKRDLASRCSKEDYADGKSGFIAGILRSALGTAADPAAPRRPAPMPRDRPARIE